MGFWSKLFGTTSSSFQIGLGDANALSAVRRGDSLLADDPTDVGTSYAQTWTGRQLTQETWSRADGTACKAIAYVYTGLFVSSAVTRVYASDGATVVAQKTESYAYAPIAGLGSYAYPTITTTRDA